jgi:uncharacterized protein (DUF1810 family)
MSLERFLIVHSILSEETEVGSSDWVSPFWLYPVHRGMTDNAWNSYYGLDGIPHAKEYLEHPILGPALRSRVMDILVFPEKEKGLRISKEALPIFRSSMTLFRAVDQDPEQVFNYAIRRIGAGECAATVTFILEEYKSPF